MEKPGWSPLPSKTVPLLLEPPIQPLIVEVRKPYCATIYDVRAAAVLVDTRPRIERRGRNVDRAAIRATSDQGRSARSRAAASRASMCRRRRCKPRQA